MTDRVVVARFQANTSTGDQDLLTSRLGGLTPKGCLFLFAQSVGVGSSADAYWGYGAASGASNRWVFSANDEDASGSTDTIRNHASDAVIKNQAPGSSAVINEADFVTFITNGVRINWSNAPATAFEIIVIFFAGADVECHADSHAATDGLVITAPGFLSTAIFSSANNDFDSGGGGLIAGLGFQDAQATPDRRSQTIAEANGGGTSEPYLSARNDASSQALDEADGTDDYSTFYDTFTASGFTARVTSDDSAAVSYFAVRMPNVAVKVGSFDAPTSTGDLAVTGVGFRPQLGVIGLNYATAENVIQSGGNAGSMGFGVFSNLDEFAYTQQVEDGQGTSDTKTDFRTATAHIPLDSGAAGFVGGLSSLDADGFTLNFSAVPAGGARKWFYIAFEILTEDLTHTTDALLEQEGELEHSSDSALKDEIDQTHETDALLKDFGFQQHSTDSLVEKETALAHDADSLIFIEGELEHSTDAALKAEIDFTHSTDAVKIDFTIAQHSTDSLLKQELSQTHDTDSLLEQLGDLNHITDALKKLQAELGHATDSLLRDIKFGQHSTDALLEEVIALSHSTDALLIEFEEIAHLSDSLLKKALEADYSTDSLLRDSGFVSHVSDSLLLATLELFHGADSFLAFVIGVDHSTDALLLQAVEFTHSTDTFIIPAPGFDRIKLISAIGRTLRLTSRVVTNIPPAPIP